MKKNVLKQGFLVLLTVILFNLAYVQAVSSKFNDLIGYDWAQNYIEEFAEKGIVSGTSSNTFSPGTNVKREEFVKVIVNTFGYETKNVSCNFRDVKKNDWFYPYIAAATNAKIINGIGNNQFGAEEYITRQDICTIIYRVLQDKGYELPETKKEVLNFLDKSSISSYALESVEKLYRAEVVNGIDAYHLSPKTFANRAQMVKIIYLADEYKLKKQDEIEPNESETKQNETENEEVKSDETAGKNSEGKSSGGNGSGGQSTGGTTSTEKEATEGKTTQESTDEKQNNKILINHISLNKVSITLIKGASETLKATIEPNNATNQNVIWSSSDTQIAAVDKNGTVTANRAGTATITVTTEEGKKEATCKVTVNDEIPTSSDIETKVAVKEVKLDKASASIEIGKTETLKATIIPNNATNQSVLWKSDKPEVATVIGGTVTGVKEGTATIAVETVEGAKIATCKVTISKKVGSIAYRTTTINKQVGDVAFTNNTLTKTGDGSVTYTSSNANVASVNTNTGEVSINGEGTATITAKVKDTSAYIYTIKEAKYTLTVSKKVVTKKTPTFTVGVTSKDVKVGNTEKVTYNYKGDGQVSVTSEDKKIATVTVDTDKKTISIKGVAVGNTTITVKAGEGATYAKATNQTINVTVKENTVKTEVSLNKTTLKVKVKDSATLKATVTTSNPNNKTVTWTSSDTKIATVDKTTGKVKGVKVGTAKIIATANDGSGMKAECKVTVEPYRILFVGSSHTYCSMYREFTINIATSKGYKFVGSQPTENLKKYNNATNEYYKINVLNKNQNIENSYYSFTQNGKDLQYNYKTMTNSKYKNAIENLKIDYLILQEATSDEVKYEEGVSNLIDLFKEKNPKMTVFLRACSCGIGTLERSIQGENNEIHERTKRAERIAEKLSKQKNVPIKVIYEGEIYLEAYNKYKEAKVSHKELLGKNFLNEYKSYLNAKGDQLALTFDLLHPNYLAAYANALATNKAMFNINPDTVDYLPEILDKNKYKTVQGRAYVIYTKCDNDKSKTLSCIEVEQKRLSYIKQLVQKYQK